MPNQLILEEIRCKKLPVIISGAGIVGKILLDICKDNDIKAECFCDNSIKVSQSGSFCGLEVIHTSDIKKKYRDAVFIISVVSIRDAIDSLKSSGFFNWYAGGLLLKDFDVSQDSPDAAID